MRQEVGDGGLERVGFLLVPLASVLERGGPSLGHQRQWAGWGGEKAATEAFRPGAWGETEPPRRQTKGKGEISERHIHHPDRHGVLVEWACDRRQTEDQRTDGEGKSVREAERDREGYTDKTSRVRRGHSVGGVAWKIRE